MGNWKHRLLRKHNIGKLVLGQFLLVFAVLILNPYPVHDIYSWEVNDPFWGFPYQIPDDFRAGTNPLNDTVSGYWDLSPYGSDTIDVIVTTEVHVHNGPSLSNDTWTTTTSYQPDFIYWRYEPPEDRSPWVDIGSVELDPGDYEVWVLIPAKDDGRVNYKVLAEDNTRTTVVEPEGEVTRDYGRNTFYLDCTFTIKEAGNYNMEADRAALSRSVYMAVIPEGSLAYPITLALGWLLILQVVTVNGYELVMRWNDRTKNKGRYKERYVFPPDVAYFFAMGPEPNWKGPAFFRFPRGTADFFRWESMSPEFPKGTDRFFDWEPGRD